VPAERGWGGLGAWEVLLARKFGKNQEILKKYTKNCRNGYSTVRVHEIDSVRTLEKWKKVRKMHKNSLKTC
jgi:hypothetical protein